MPRKRSARSRDNWAAMVRKLRLQMELDQTAFGQKLESSAMAVSRWERGAQAPPSRAYIELGNVAGDPDCWYFWGRAGLHSEDLMRVMPGLQRRLRSISAHSAQEMASAGAGGKKKVAPAKETELVILPLLKVVAATPGEKGDPAPLLDGA